ncbi:MULTISPECIES: hypothetical protein [Rothia]|uniref:Transporter n=1 Tax=Rothia nasimurium TaxID=85336 RepID=A0A1Y1RLJ1_9MICC|nr:MULTISPECIES: hypothetical protein [Rothia]ORC15228.1 hypothetical protein A7979_07740 [Rothia nasimurium]
MVAVLLKLKLDHFLAIFRNGNVWAIVGLVIGLLYGLGVLVGLAGYGSVLQNPADSLLLLGLAGGLLTLAWWLIPLVAAGADPTLDPERLAPYPITVRQLMSGQAMGALIGVPGTLTVLAALALVTSNLYSLPATLAFIPASLLGVTLAVLGGRLTAVASIPIRSRRALSNALTIAAFTALVFAGPLIMAVTAGIASNMSQLRHVLTYLQWTPLASAWAIAPQVGAGRYGLAAALAALTLIYCALAWFIWKFFAAKTMASVGDTAIQRDEGKTVEEGNLGLLGRFPATVRGAIAARTLGMMLKDSRANLNVLILPLMYILMITISGSFIFTVNGAEGTVANPMTFIMVGAFIPAMAGYSQSTLASLDGSAFSLHALSPLRGIDDRLGRAYGMMLLYLPMIVVGTLAFSFLTGNAIWALPLLVTSLGTYFIANGMANYLDTTFNAPVVPPGTSPWKTPEQPDGMAKTMVRGLLIFIPMALSLPALIGMGASSITGNILWFWLGATVTALIGALAFYLGVRAGAKNYELHVADMYQRVARYS